MNQGNQQQPKKGPATGKPGAPSFQPKQQPSPKKPAGTGKI